MRVVLLCDCHPCPTVVPGTKKDGNSEPIYCGEWCKLGSPGNWETRAWISVVRTMLYQNTVAGIVRPHFEIRIRPSVAQAQNRLLCTVATSYSPICFPA